MTLSLSKFSLLCKSRTMLPSALPSTLHKCFLVDLTNQRPELPHFSHNTLFLHLRDATSLPEARRLHGLVLVHGYLHVQPSRVLGSLLVSIYNSLGSLHEALLVFNHLPRRNSFAWNSILRGLVNAGRFSETIEFYHNMIGEGLKADNFTYPLVLKACSGLADLELGRKIHESIRCDGFLCNNKEPNAYVRCALIDMYAKCGSLKDAREIFDEMPVRDVVSWAVIICGTMQNGDWIEALNLFKSMSLEGFTPDSVIIATVIPACGRLGELGLGMGLHCFAIKSGLVDDLCVSNALIDMYCKCGYTQKAYDLFRLMEYKDVISWSSLVAGYSQNCEYVDSIESILEMMAQGIRPSSVTIASVLPSISEMKLFKQGREVHCYAIRHGFDFDTFVANALIDFYFTCGMMREAEYILELTSHKDIAMWNSMIAGYALKGDLDSAFEILRRIGNARQRPDSITLVTVLPLCSHFTMLSQGKELHAHALRGGLGQVVSVNNSLIDLYCKCGYAELGKKVFEHMVDRNVVTYNIIIAAFGMHGHGDQAMLFFEHMKKEGLEPDEVTFIALISACSHAGLIEWGLLFYNSMTEDYSISPDMEHYSCMVDLYGRSGYLENAWEFIERMPMEPGIDVLGSLLGACRVHKKAELAELVGEKIFEKKHEDPGYHILLSNIYAAAGRWEDATKVRTKVNRKGLMKKAGNSWI